MHTYIHIHSCMGKYKDTLILACIHTWLCTSDVCHCLSAVKWRKICCNITASQVACSFHWKSGTLRLNETCYSFKALCSNVYHYPTNMWDPQNTGYTQKNGAVSKVNKKFISHLARAQRTPSAAATVQVSHALPAVRFWPVSKMASQQEKAFCLLRFEVSRSVITVHETHAAL